MSSTTKVKGLTAAGPFTMNAGALTACGLFPIPLERGGKRPAIAWKPYIGKRLVESDWDDADAYIGRWWSEPKPYNLGVPTGIGVYVNETDTLPLVVVDVDDQDARELVERTCGWPHTPTVRTSHGWHLWLVHDEPVGNRAKVAGVGLDVRGWGGFVVVPPSLHPEGNTYLWGVGLDVWPPARKELAELIWPTNEAVGTTQSHFEDRPRVIGRADSYVRAALEAEVAAVAAASEGRRNDQLNRSAFALARFVRDGTLPASQYVENLTSAASRAGLPDVEIRRTLASALQGRQ